MVDENMEMVSKAELNELRACKRKLGADEAEQQREKKRLKTLENLVTNNELIFRRKNFSSFKFNFIVFLAKRSQIRLTLRNAVKLFTERKFEHWSESKQVAGFKWLIRAKKREEHPNLVSLDLFTYPPAQYKGSYDFDVE